MALRRQNGLKRHKVFRYQLGRRMVQADESWDGVFAGPKLDDDFLETRNQPMLQRRKESRSSSRR
jgi:hypothetical protein